MPVWLGVLVGHWLAMVGHWLAGGWPVVGQDASYLQIGSSRRSQARSRSQEASQSSVATEAVDDVGIILLEKAK